MAGATIIDPCLVRVIIKCKTPTQIGENVLYYRVVTVTGAAVDLQAVTGEVSDEVQAAYRAWMPAEASLMGIEGQIVWPILSMPYLNEQDADVGTNSGDLLPTQVSGCITKRTALGGPSNRGRIYVPFCSTDSAAPSGNLNAPGYVLLQNVAVAIPVTMSVSNGVGGATIFKQVLSVAPHALATAKDLTDLFPRDKFATQRRRGQYGSPNT